MANGADPITLKGMREALLAARAQALEAQAEAARAKAIASDLEARNALLELQNAQMRRALYGQRSEHGSRLIDQLELALADAEAAAAEDEALAQHVAEGTRVEGFVRKRPSPRSFPEHLARERVVIPAPPCCPCCGSDRLSKLGEDVTETL